LSCTLVESDMQIIIMEQLHSGDLKTNQIILEQR
jgi:hypothetical protein